MVYKKYIKKGGKFYGPYIYHSKRINGKVVSEYHGIKKRFNFMNILWVSSGILFLAFLIYFLLFSGKGITGMVTLGIDAKYEEGSPLEGKLNLILKEGELIPGSSKIVFENAGQVYEFDLSEIVSGELVEGAFYVKGKSFSGTGLGYGIEGTKTDYPDVYFILDVYSEQTSEEGSSGGGSEVEETTRESAEETGETEGGISEEIVEESETEGTTEVTEITEQISVEETPAEETEESATAPITGGVIRRIFRLTGKVTMELENEVSGKVSANKEFVYELKEGQRAELRPKSVKTDSGELKDNEVSVKIQDNKVIVTTDYSEKQKGFGEKYLGNNEKTFSIDLRELNLVLEKGGLITRLVYENEEIISLTTMLEEGETISNETVIEEEENKTIVKEKLNETIEEINQTINESFGEKILVGDVGDFLTEEEKEILVNKFGNVSIKTVKSELFKDRVIVKYQIGEYSVEYSYDSSLSDEVLELQMELDRIKWLKDIAKNLLKEETSSQELEKFKKNYTVITV